MGILTVQVTEILSLNEIVINIIDCDADASVSKMFTPTKFK